MHLLSQLETSKTPLSETDRSSRQKNIVKFNNTTINQLDIIDIYRLVYLTTAKHTYLLSSRGTFSKTDYTTGHKTHFIKF